MVSALVLRGHWVHVIVFGIPIAGLVGAVAAQEIRARFGSPGADRRPDPQSPHLRVAAAGLVAAAVIHAIVIPEHFREWWLFGVFFSVLMVAQLVLAVLVAYRPNRRMVRSVAVASAWIVVLWLVSRTSGIPLGPEQWQPESIGRLDIAASVAELITLVGCATQLSATSHRRPLTVPRIPEMTA
jgi:hypothetical protein